LRYNEPFDIDNTLFSDTILRLSPLLPLFSHRQWYKFCSHLSLHPTTSIHSPRKPFLLSLAPTSIPGARPSSLLISPVQLLSSADQHAFMFGFLFANARRPLPSRRLFPSLDPCSHHTHFHVAPSLPVLIILPWPPSCPPLSFDGPFQILLLSFSSLDLSFQFHPQLTLYLPGPRPLSFFVLPFPTYFSSPPAFYI